MDRDLTLGGEHILQYKETILQNCTPETYMILLASVTPITPIKF